MRLFWTLVLSVATAFAAGSSIRTQRAEVRARVTEAPLMFRAVGVYGAPEARVRASADGVRWSEWIEVHSDSPDEGGFAWFDTPRRFLESDRPVQVLFIDPGNSPRRATLEQPRVITRAEWGCAPEQCAFRGGSPVVATVTHLVVHHSAGGNSASDWSAVVRSIWALHVNGNGWSDIGYNYLISPDGALYEGRQGGDGVIGAHFSGVNTGTMGVCLIGTFSTVAPFDPAIRTLVQTLAWHARRWGLDPSAEALHTASQLRLNVISGHRDASLSPRASGTTECPGNGVYAILPRLREDVFALMNSECPVRITAPSACVNGGGGTMRLSIEGCSSATLESRTEWIKVAADGTLTFDPNTGSRRTGTVQAGARWISFTQGAANEANLPCVASRGVLSAGAATPVPVVAGSLLSIYGTGFPATPTVTVNGNRNAPVLFANANQINVQLPTGINTGSARLTVSGGPETLFWITEAAPSIFVAQNHEGGAVHSADAPVRAGAPLIVYLTGAGRDGLPWTARVGGRTAERLYLGPTPGFPGLFQANIVIPPDAPAGAHKLDLTIAGATASLDVYVRQ